VDLVSRNVVNSPTSWSISVFTVSTLTDQERILHAFERVGRPGVKVLGAHNDDGYFVVLDCERLVDELHARRVVMAVDRHATRSSFRRGQHADDGVAGDVPAVLQMVRRHIR
jgi:hypothetical protein